MRVLIAGGGTGGHINPAIAIAGEIKKNEPDSVILFAGTPKGMESVLVPKANFDFTTIRVAGFQRQLTLYNIFRNIKAVIYLFTSQFRARTIIKKFRPDIVIGTGGYVSGPIVKAAQNMGIKTAIHEQNAFPGVTTKMLSSGADAVMLAFAEAEKFLPKNSKVVVTGNPIREGIVLKTRKEGKEAFGFDDRTTVLSFGGSLGALTINRLSSELLRYNTDGKWNYIHATGKYGTELFPKLLEEKGIKDLPENVKILEYIDNMDAALAASDIVISRAGAITLSELAARGVASVLIPSPNVAENHQYKNALAVKEKGAAEVFEDKNLDIAAVAKEIADIINDKEKIETLRKNASKTAIIDAAEIIYKVIKEIMQ